MPSVEAGLRALETSRLRALVDADAAVLDALHAPEFVLINPSGGAWSKAEYLGGVLAGDIDYRRFEVVSAIEGGPAVQRYRSAIDIHVRGQQPGPLSCWHTDCYRVTSSGAGWQAVWSQATEIRSGDPAPH